MRIMARVAQRALRMVLGVNLRKTLRLGRIRFMAAHAQCGNVGLLRFVPVRIVCVLGERAMAGLASHVRVFPLATLLGDFIMADRASSLAGERNWPSPNLTERCTAVVAILREAWWYDKMPDQQERYNREREGRGKPEQVFRLFQYVLHR